ncbi:PASTA domain-containing protein [Pseudonocardia sp. C8]|uniref:PASTA domain-containing protein n=1 Tax=Pseudonocardia sp. C8 TaxID=2762759 RepID=UPI0016434712|nr:PASTA domain-containing protein [Pseudonocardia sp. C8]MBC3192200.1 PASTA domain-containing protein [Pseudonocardia sp. C8]
MGESRRAVVPTLVGLSTAAAHDAALDAGLLAVLQQPAPADPSSVPVTAQRPAPGRRLHRGAQVRIWAVPDDPGDDSGGGGGHRVPVNPGPKTPAGTKPGP